MRTDALDSAMRADIAAGLTPTFVCASVGTTSCTAIDDVDAIARAIDTAGARDAWLHVDAAHAGAACVCPEFQSWLRGVERARGEWEWIAESDDAAEPGLLAALAARLGVAPDIVAVACDSRAVDEAGASLGTVQAVEDFGAGTFLIFGGLSGWAVGSGLLFILFLTHALLGAVELGTDGWIQNITGNILSSEQGKILFVFTSMTMFALRFCADFIERF
jgi:hypothetical protein